MVSIRGPSATCSLGGQGSLDPTDQAQTSTPEFEAWPHLERSSSSAVRTQDCGRTAQHVRRRFLATSVTQTYITPDRPYIRSLPAFISAPTGYRGGRCSGRVSIHLHSYWRPWGRWGGRGGGRGCVSIHPHSYWRPLPPPGHRRLTSRPIGRTFGRRQHSSPLQLAAVVVVVVGGGRCRASIHLHSYWRQ